MSKVRVYELAKQHNMDPKSLVALFQSSGISDVRNHMSAVEAEVAERIVKRHLERQKAPVVEEERIRPTVVKRRARTPDAEPSGHGEIPPARSSSHEAVSRAVAPPARTSQPGERAPAAHMEPEPPPRPRARPSEPQIPPPAAEAPSFEPPTPARPSDEHRAAPPARPSSPVAEHAPPPAPPAPAVEVTPALAQAPAIVQQALAAVQAQVTAPAQPRPEEPPAQPRPEEPPARVEARAPEAPVVEVAPVAAPAPKPSEPVAPPPAPPAPVVEVAPPAPTPAPKPAAPPSGPAVTPPPPPSAKPQHEPAAARPMHTGPRSTPVPPPPSRRVVEEPPQSAGGPATSRRAPASTPPAPKTGIDVWAGRPGVPMPAARTGAPPARRTTYDPRAAATPARPGAPGPFGQNRGGGGQMGGRGRPGFRGGRPMQGGAGGLQRKPAMVSTQEMASHKKVIKIEEQVTLQQLAGKMSVKSTDVLMRLLSMGMTGVNINSTLDADTAKILASEFGWSVEDVAVSEADTLTAAMGAEIEGGTDYEIRPPIVTVMGHVDHGKTSLLDRIRKATVAEGEAGGITQHIGAYRVDTPRGTIAFLDTPGHEAFTAMRARGASVTDIVILVVAADDGVMPQTREAFSHAQAAKVPIIVAVNKIDKPGADPEKIMRDLSAMGLQPEDWGGDTMFVNVSAKTGVGIDQLLEACLLQAEVLELKANPKKRASGTVIEALLDRGRGPVARVMVQDGTLRTGDVVLAGGAWGKVRAMTDEFGRAVAEAGPSTPVEVLGLAEVPSAGDPVHAVKDAKTAEEIAETRRKKASKTLIPQDSRVSLEALTTRLSEADQLELKLIIKGDVQGSVEAVGHALAKLSTQKVKVTIVHAAVGGITEGDVNLAVASKAIIVGFNVRPAGKASSHAEAEGVEIRLYNIIYNAVDDIRSAMEGLLPATKVEKILGRAECRQVFRVQKIGVVAGSMVISGLVRRTAEARLIRDNVVVWTGRLSGLRRFKDDAKEVAEGLECGISLENYADIKEGDIIECFEIEEIKTKLS